VGTGGSFLGVWSVEAATDVSGALDACRERLGLSLGAGAVRVAVAPVYVGNADAASTDITVLQARKKRFELGMHECDGFIFVKPYFFNKWRKLEFFQIFITRKIN
jgi:activator of 2-hydroxyglutaryl-CoA dehydratase